MKKLSKVFALCMAFVMVLSMSTINVTASTGATGTKENPKTPTEMSGLSGYYFMSDALEDGDSDGIWYEHKVAQNAVLSLAVNCYSDVDYTVEATVLDKNGAVRVTADNSEGNPIILGTVSRGETVLVHKYVNNGAAASVNVVATYAAGSNVEPVALAETATVVVRLAAGETIYLQDANSSLPFTQGNLVVTGEHVADAIIHADKDYAGTGKDKIELTLGGSKDNNVRVCFGITNNAKVMSVLTLSVEGKVTDTPEVPDTPVVPEEPEVPDTPVEPEEPVVEHKLVHFDAVAAGCHSLGNVEYWYCTDCEGFWLDEACTQLTNSKSVNLPATGGNLVYFEAVTPGCHNLGNVEYWYCTDCEGFWLDEACTQLTNSKSVNLPATGGNLVHFEAVTPGCHSNGNVEYWYCADCEGFWTDEACTQLTNSKSVNLPATGSQNLQHVEAVAPAVAKEGNVEHWYCPDCEGYWLDEACTQLTNSKSVILPAVVEDEPEVVPPVEEPEHKHNLVHFDAVAAGCHSNGNIEYWFCPDCEGFWQDEACTQLTNSKNVIVPATGSENLVHFDAVAAGCHSNGAIEYWYCPDCEGFWQDEACTQLTNSKNIIVPATGSENVEHVAAKAPTCYENGNIEYWYCADCEGFWQNEACTQLTNSKNVVLAAEHANLVHFDAVAAGCHSNGNVEYWFCPDCEGFWTDEALTQVTNSKNIIVPATGSENVVHFEAVEPGCHSLGNVEYWYCADCEGFWLDEACTQVTNSKSVNLPATGGNLVHFEAVEAGCHYNGNIEYWYCTDCDGFWTDEACTQVTNSKNVVLPATGAEVIHFEAIEAGCHYDGQIEYWYCAECEQYWQDEALTQVTNSKNVVLPAVGGEVNHVEAVAPAVGVEGNIEYWYCAECEQYWQDEALTQITNSKNVIIPALGDVHTGVSNEDFYADSTILSEEAEQYKKAEEALKDVVAEKDFVVIEINLYNKDNEQVHEPNEVIVVTIPVPENLELGEGQIYVVYRINVDGSYTACDTALVDGEIVFETNHFSTFVVVVEDEVPATPDEPTEPETPVVPDEPTEPETPVEPDEPAEPETPDDGEENVTPETPETGDNANMILWISILGLGVAAVAGSVVMKRRAI